ncbi:MAG: hypothetical protein V4550_08940 [Gemmatimonadota bacterium]
MTHRRVEDSERSNPLGNIQARVAASHIRVSASLAVAGGGSATFSGAAAGVGVAPVFPTGDAVGPSAPGNHAGVL